MIADVDQEKGTALAETLIEYIRQDCDKNKACANLGIHRNTLSFRLQCIETLLGSKIGEGESLYTLKFMDLLRQISSFQSREVE